MMGFLFFLSPLLFSLPLGILVYKLYTLPCLLLGAINIFLLAY